MKKHLDVFRNEQRFLILVEDLQDFISDISKILHRVSFSDRPITRTIYFNNADYPIPWGYSVKARKYLKDFSSNIFINRRDAYRLEIKASGKGDLRTKIQQELSLSQANQFIFDNLRLNLRPYAVDEYSRSQFISTEEQLRLTIDCDVKYGFFEEESLRANWVGSEDFVRIELKTDPDYLTSSEYQQVSQLIANYSPWPIVSKRQHAFSFIKFVLGKKGRPLIKELKDCEIEAKFLVDCQNPALLLLNLKNHFRISTGDYYLNSDFTYTQEGASINHYWLTKNKANQEVDGLKLMFLGRAIKPVFKEGTKVLSDPYGLGCILERKEVKGSRFVYTKDYYDNFLKEVVRNQGNLTYLGYLRRSRRAFWLDNRINGRIYHISLDRCLIPNGGILWQMEVEYTGRHVSYMDTMKQEWQKTKQTIRQEVAELAKETLSFCNQSRNVLSPTTITKFNWLKASL